MRTVRGGENVAVVGGGLAGLSAALHLLGAGRQVTVFEQEPRPGGRAGGFAASGRHGDVIDSGASVLTMPEYAEEAFAAVGVRMADLLTLRKLDPAYRAHFADGSSIRLYTEADAMEEEIRRVAGPAEAEGYRRLRRWLTELYAVQRDRFIGSNFDSPFDLLRPELVKLAALGGFGRLGPKIGSFLRDERVRRLFSFQSLYAGLDPARALGAYGVISYMDTVGGVYYPVGGMSRVAEAMAKAVELAGGQVRYSSRVAWLERVGHRVRAVRTAEGQRSECDAVVLATELTGAYRLLGIRPRRALPLRFAPSAFVLHGNSARGWSELDHHTIFFGRAWSGTFDEIIRQGKLMSDPSLLVTNPTRSEPGLSFSGRELISVLAPAPNTRAAGIDWPSVGPAYRDELLRNLEKRGLPGFAGDVEVTDTVTPADWARKGLGAGTPFSLAHTFGQTGPFRPANLVRGAENVVLAGCGTTPGVGIPPVLISGRLAATRITG